MAKIKVSFYIIVLPLIVLAIAAISYFRLLDTYELGMLDMRFQLRPTPPVTDKVVIIEIGNDTLEVLGGFPFTRDNYSVILRALQLAGAKAVVIDLFFDDNSKITEKDYADISELDKDLAAVISSFNEELAAAIQYCGNVYLSYAFDFSGKRSNLSVPEASRHAAINMPIFSNGAKGEGHINVDVDRDGKYRKLPLYIKYEDAIYPYVSFLAACDYLGIQQASIKQVWGKYIDLGQGRRIPLDEHSNMIINFSGKWGQVYKHYSFLNIIQSYVNPDEASLDLKKIFKDKVCVIGLTATGTPDLHPNPFEKIYPAVGIHAEVFNSIINNRFISRSSRSINLLILLVLCLPIVIMAVRARPAIALIFLGLTILIFVAVSILLFNLMGIWIDLFFPILAAVVLYFIMTFHKYFTEWRKRLILENELGIAKKIQESFLPRRLPSTDGLEVAVSMFTARQVGGDLYDFIEFGKDKVGIVIGDVSGKGVPASLFMAMVSAEFKFFAMEDAAPDGVLMNLNKRLVQESASNLFVTVFYMVFDIKNRYSLQYSNGGHLPVIHISRSGETKLLDTEEGAPLGLMESSYLRKEVKISAGDIFILYTDGVTEAMNARSEMYGVDRLLKVAMANKSRSPRELLDAIEKDVRRFEPKNKQHDDITIMVIKIL